VGDDNDDDILFQQSMLQAKQHTKPVNQKTRRSSSWLPNMEHSNVHNVKKQQNSKQGKKTSWN